VRSAGFTVNFWEGTRGSTKGKVARTCSTAHASYPKCRKKVRRGQNASLHDLNRLGVHQLCCVDWRHEHQSAEVAVCDTVSAHLGCRV